MSIALAMTVNHYYAGVLLMDILNATSSVIAGDKDRPKLYLISAHENNVAGLMAAIRVFKPHQPRYGATISLELRRRPSTGQYGFMVNIYGYF